MACAELPRVLTLLALELAVIKSSDPKSHQETREQYFYKIRYSRFLLEKKNTYMDFLWLFRFPESMPHICWMT